MKADKSGSVRRGLTDITNSCRPRPSPSPPPPPQKSPLTPISKSLVENLLRENAVLNELVEERGKMVAKSRVDFQKLQAQNTTLAKSNTQILTELNAVKDKLRVREHELACKNVVLKARDMEQEEEEVEATKPSCVHIIADKHSTHSRRQNQQRQSLGAPSTREKEDEKFKVQKRRQPLRRQSRRFQTRVLEPKENLFEIEEAKYLITQPVNTPKPDQKLEITCSSQSKEGEESHSCSASGKETAKRSSMGRPLRRAAEKVQSYKEIPLNIKMRRLE